ncbi:MAG: hypothetical protein ACREGJ_04270 [Candidatus Saccharimonadales bacterium]
MIKKIDKACVCGVADKEVLRGSLLVGVFTNILFLFFGLTGTILYINSGGTPLIIYLLLGWVVYSLALIIYGIFRYRSSGHTLSCSLRYGILNLLRIGPLIV